MVVRRTTRGLGPGHYELTITNFDLLKKADLEYLESEAFDAGEYKWSLRLYPDGDPDRNASGHFISLYLVLDESARLPTGSFDIKVDFKLFALDQIQNQWLVCEEDSEAQKRFHAGRRVFGFHQFLTRKAFEDPAGGYKIANRCVFGAEVFIIKTPTKNETFNMIQLKPPRGFLSWVIPLADVFAKQPGEALYSSPIKAGKYSWKLVLYPRGDYQSGTVYVSLYLERVQDPTPTTKTKAFAEFKLRVKDQFPGRNDHKERKVSKWFTDIDNKQGYSDFMRVADLYDSPKGFAFNNQLIVELEMLVVSDFVVGDS